jgi:hypothetical protein
MSDTKRLNIVLPITLYNQMVEKVKRSDIKNITELIKVSANNLLKDDIEKDGSINYEELPEILEILEILYEVKKFKNPNAKLELHFLYNDIKRIVQESKNGIDSIGKKYNVNRLDISMKELIVLELSCKELDKLIKNNIIKEGVCYAR